MAKSDNLRKAKEVKNDEFYTLLSDIENELKHYKKHFENKIVLCNCDDPFESNFFKYFALNFNSLKLKRLICTCYGSSPIVGEQLSLFDLNYEIKDRKQKAYKIVINEIDDANGDGAVDLSDIEFLIKNKKNTLSLLKGDGDFRSDECVKLLKEADVVVTNPPFSLASEEYIPLLMNNNKKFLVIGDLNWITYRDFFNYLKNNQVWLGYNAVKSFVQPDKQIKKFGNKRWYTNLDIDKRHERLILYKTYQNGDYKEYYNYDGIDVSLVSNIPSDYSGHMGVPISFLEQYNPEQFRIIGLGSNIEKKYIHTVTENKKTISYIDRISNEVKYSFPYSVSERKIGNGLRLSDNGQPGGSPYGRIIIQRIDESEDGSNGNKAA